MRPVSSETHSLDQKRVHMALIDEIHVALEARPQAFVEYGQGGVNERHGMAGRENESVGEAALGLPDVPAHRARQEQNAKKRWTLEREPAEWPD